MATPKVDELNSSDVPASLSPSPPSLVCTLTQTIIDKIQLIWLRNCLGLSWNILREVCTYLGDAFLLVSISPSELTRYDPVQNRWLRPSCFSREITWDVNSRYAMVDTNRLICCGGDYDTNRAVRAYLLHLLRNPIQIEKLPDMTEKRSLAGLIVIGGSLFVFSGFGRPRLRTGESMSFNKPSNWTTLPGQMREGRSQFSPCRFENRIYLPGGNIKLIDYYDLESRSFGPVNEVTLIEAVPSLAWIADDTLFIVTRNYLLKTNLRSGTSEGKTHSPVNINFRAQPVMYDGYLYWVEENGSGRRMKADDEAVIVESLSTNKI